MIALTPDQWLSDMMERPVHRVALVPGTSRTLPSPRGFYYARVPTEDIPSVVQLGDLGFRIVDTSITLERKCVSEGGAEATVRAAAPGDRDAVTMIARTAFRYSRFHLDPLIPKILADHIKAGWADNYFAGTRGDHMLVAQSDGQIAGFLQLIHASDSALVIDLIAVTDRARGRGLARAMIGAAQRLARGACVRVGTQIANLASLRLYESLGFRAVTSNYVMHLHA
jgi:ribosomal protein S18 acetylase RimI-like enzyme